MRFRLFTGNYSPYTFQCVTPKAADAALALKRTWANPRPATVPEAYSPLPAVAFCLHPTLLCSEFLQNQTWENLFFKWMSLFGCVVYMSHHSTAAVTDKATHRH